MGRGLASVYRWRAAVVCFLFCPRVIARIGVVAILFASEPIAVVVEMTALATVLAPMLAASVCAILVAAALRTRPIYEDLRERMLHPPAVRSVFPPRRDRP